MTDPDPAMRELARDMFARAYAEEHGTRPTAPDPDPRPNRVPREGNQGRPKAPDADLRAFARELFGHTD